MLATLMTGCRGGREHLIMGISSCIRFQSMPIYRRRALPSSLSMLIVIAVCLIRFYLTDTQCISAMISSCHMQNELRGRAVLQGMHVTARSCWKGRRPI